MKRQNKSNWEGNSRLPILILEGTSGLLYEFADVYFPVKADTEKVSEPYHAYKTMEGFETAKNAGLLKFLPHL